MKPIKNELTDKVLKAPSNLPEGVECQDLAVCYNDGYYYSYWKPSLKEWFKILMGGHIRLVVNSLEDRHPIVTLDTLK